MSGPARPPFVPFDEETSVRIYRRNLPHWRQEGCTYFVTFRLADSIPAGVRQAWEYEQTLWLKARGIHYDGPAGQWRRQLDKKLSPADLARFETHFNGKVQACLDRGLGRCWLKHRSCADVLATQLFKADGEQHDLGDFVIMPNHVHVLITPRANCQLELILKAIKGKAAIDCNARLHRSGSFWQPDSYDHIVRDVEQLLALRRYIATNPINAGIEVPPTALYHADWLGSSFK